MLLESCGAFASEAETRLEAVTFDDLAVEAARRAGAGLLIRGLRDGSDLDYEMQLAGMNATLAPEVQTVFLPASPMVRPITATLVRQIAEMGGEVSAFVPPPVQGRLAAKYPPARADSKGGSMFRALALALALAFSAPALAQTLPPDPENTVVLETTKGRVVIRLRNDVAPNHAERIKRLAREGFYDNVPFHRVIEGFMAQTGDGQNGNGTGGSKYPDLTPGILEGALHPRRGRHGPHLGPQLGQRAVLHHVCAVPQPQQQVHRGGRGDRGHGCRRPDQERRAGARSRQDRQDDGCGRREVMGL